MNHESKINIGFWESFWLLACMLCLSACSTNKHLLEDQAFVHGNTIELIGDKGKNVKKNKLKNGLLGLVKQQPNDKFLGINRRWFYYNKLKKGKIDKEKQLGKRTIYEEPSIFAPELAEETTAAMTNYLKDRGFFRPMVSYTTNVENKQLTVNYLVKLGKLYTIDTVRFISPDTSIQKILTEISSTTILKKGEPVANQLYEEEKRRITNHLRNIGYREFYINYIDQLSTKADTAISTQLPLILTVFPFSDEQSHQIYKINNISIFPYVAPNTDLSTLQDTLIDGIRFYMPSGRFPIKPEVISKRIFLEKGALYSQENFNKTVRSLGSLGIFKYANIKDQVSQDSSNKIDFNIYLPANKKIVLGADIEIRNTFLSESSIITNNFLGGALNFSYRNRNLLRGSEELRVNFGIGGEFGSVEGSRVFQSFDVTPQIELDIPKFSDPFRFVRFLNRLKLFSDDFYKSLHENATTRLSFGVKWSQRRQFWGYFSSDFSIGYQLQKNPKRRYFVNQFGLNLFKPSVSERGQVIFDNNPFLERSFNNSQLFTGILFKDFGMVFTGRNNRTKDSYRLNLSFELSGAEVFLANTIYNEFQKQEASKITFQIFNLDFSQFARIDIDGSFYKYVTNRHTLAFRLNVGWAKPYGFSTDIPYVKQFFAGGPTSIRAWKIRELGPGSYQDPGTFPGYSANSTPFYQTGDIKILFSAEYRFNMFKVYSFDLEGALFLDGGNVWTSKVDPDRPGAEWSSSSFYKQIALGSGIGFRMDFEYFKLALDLGYRVRNPYPNSVGSYWAYERWRELKLKGINYNLAVGYPF